MRCPYCQTQLRENTTECPSCQLSLASANAIMGPVPILAKGLNDTVNLLAKPDAKKIQQNLSNLSRKFPQVDMHVITRDLDPQLPISTHLFWLFNQGDVCASDSKGGKNRTILLALDPDNGRIGLMVGYGLEPFLPRKTLDHTLEKAQPSLDSGDFAAAIHTVINALDELMTGICDGFSESLGIHSHLPTKQQNSY